MNTESEKVRVQPWRTDEEVDYIAGIGNWGSLAKHRLSPAECLRGYLQSRIRGGFGGFDRDAILKAIIDRAMQIGAHDTGLEAARMLGQDAPEERMAA